MQRSLESAGDDFAFNDENPLGIWVGAGGVAVLLAIGAALLRQAAPWRELIDTLDTRSPRRVRVTEFTAAVRTQWRPLVDYAPVSGDEPGAVFRLYPQPPFVYPRAGEELEVWPLRDDRRGPLMFRRVTDGSWWCGLYRPRLQPVDA